MANELFIQDDLTGQTYYVLIQVGASLVKSSDASLITRSASAYDDAAIAMSDAAAPGYYLASVPSGLAAGVYQWAPYQKLAANVYDRIGSFRTLHWSGTAEVAMQSAAGIRTALGMASADLDTQLDAIEANGGAATITGDVTYAGPVAVDGTVDLYRGDAITLAWEIEDYTGSVTDGEAIACRFLSIDSYDDASATTYNALLNKTGTADLTAGTLTLSFALSNTDTNTLTAGANGDGTTKYRCQVIATTSNITLVDVVATVRRRIGVAS